MREFLKGLELEQETIEKIMAEYGKKIKESINENNDDKDVINTLKKEVKNLKSEIEGYKTTIEENNKSLENLQVVTNENKQLKAEIQMNGSGVKKEFSKFVTSEVMSNVNDKTDFTTALENYKKDNPQYFGETVVKKVQSSPVLAGGNNQPQNTNDIMNNIIRSSREN